ncbi:hypothetical protein QR680_001174 [Steinernema hermaphroditum]|uniref:Uncharacterized protein n=1 Tax=Steinernema hermaphroditum TaxID=289476 RepID=A0AA39LEX8_9BILA|nr:hypothetical protein QR680_001174 [Steinernema hermaphroditum]
MKLLLLLLCATSLHVGNSFVHDGTSVDGCGPTCEAAFKTVSNAVLLEFTKKYSADYLITHFPEPFTTERLLSSLAVLEKQLKDLKGKILTLEFDVVWDKALKDLKDDTLDDALKKFANELKYHSTTFSRLKANVPTSTTTAPSDRKVLFDNKVKSFAEELKKLEQDIFETSRIANPGIAAYYRNLTMQKIVRLESQLEELLNSKKMVDDFINLRHKRYTEEQAKEMLENLKKKAFETKSSLLEIEKSACTNPCTSDVATANADSSCGQKCSGASTNDNCCRSGCTSGNKKQEAPCCQQSCACRTNEVTSTTSSPQKTSNCGCRNTCNQCNSCSTNNAAPSNNQQASCQCSCNNGQTCDNSVQPTQKQTCQCSNRTYGSQPVVTAAPSTATTEAPKTEAPKKNGAVSASIAGALLTVILASSMF